MFGYVRPAMERLAEEEQQRYKALYCGLCHTLSSRYGGISSMILNYDFAFLAALLSDSFSPEYRRCIVSPLKKRQVAAPDSALELAADCSVILAYWKARDEVDDSSGIHRQGYRALSGILEGSYRRAAALHPAFNAATQRELRRLAALERERCASLDQPADTFAKLLQGIAEEVPDGIQRRVLSQFLYHLGRWIYLVDALDDLKDDAEHEGYNPILLRFSLENGTLSEPVKQAVGATLDASIRQMAAAYELWDFGVWSPLICSTVYQGLYCVGNAVIEGTFHAADGRRVFRGKKEQI